MKKLTLLLMLFTAITNAQIVNIPDANFKAKLLAATATNYIAVNLAGSSTIIDINSDGQIQLSEALNISRLNIDSSNISAATGIESFTNLQDFHCDFNPLNSMDLTPLSNLVYLSCNSCQLNFLNVHGLTNLTTVFCHNNLFTSLDLGGTAVTSVAGNHNHNLQYVNLKNGVISTCMALIGMPDACVVFDDCPALTTICCDQNDLQFFNGSFPGVMLITYCSFIPGGNFNTITGTAHFDSNNNGCDITDPAISNIRINLINDAGQIATYTDGNYNFYVQQGDCLLTPILENPTYFNVSPASTTLTFADNNNNSTTQDFCITAAGIHPDLEIVILPLTEPRPGFNATYKIVYKNKGNQLLSGAVNLTFDDAKTDFISALPTADNLAVNLLTWNYSNLQPFETRSINLTLYVHEPPAVNAGDFIAFTASINPITADELPLDNTFSLNQMIVNSQDPNDKTCLEGATVTPDNIGKFLHYNINFENIGTESATNIVVKDIIDTTKYDLSSLQLIDASHPVETRINANVVEFIFKNINLPSTTINPGASHGNVSFKIKSRSDLVTGNQVANTANIFFDYNAPITTNQARTTFANLNNAEFIKDNSISISPNPTKGIINITANSNISSMQVFDIQGRILQTIADSKTATTINLAVNQSGVYFLKISTTKGTKTEKIIKID